jgi:hypothetical protein
MKIPKLRWWIAGTLAAATAPLALAIVFFSMAIFGHSFWSTILQTLAADMFPTKIVGSVAGLMGAVGSFGGVVFNLVIGFLLTTYGSYVLWRLRTGIRDCRNTAPVVFHCHSAGSAHDTDGDPDGRCACGHVVCLDHWMAGAERVRDGSGPTAGARVMACSLRQRIGTWMKRIDLNSDTCL